MLSSVPCIGFSPLLFFHRHCQSIEEWYHGDFMSRRERLCHHRNALAKDTSSPLLCCPLRVWNIQAFIRCFWLGDWLRPIHVALLLRLQPFSQQLEVLGHVIDRFYWWTWVRHVRIVPESDLRTSPPCRFTIQRESRGRSTTDVSPCVLRS